MEFGDFWMTKIHVGLSTTTLNKLWLRTSHIITFFAFGASKYEEISVIAFCALHHLLQVYFPRRSIVWYLHPKRSGRAPGDSDDIILESANNKAPRDRQTASSVSKQMSRDYIQLYLSCVMMSANATPHDDSEYLNSDHCVVTVTPTYDGFVIWLVPLSSFSFS